MLMLLVVFSLVASACATEVDGGACADPDGVVASFDSAEVSAFVLASGFDAGQLDRMIAAPDEGPFYTFDLVGRSADSPLVEMADFVDLVGAEVVFRAQVDEQIQQIGGDDVDWQSVTVIEYPCAAAQLALLIDPVFREAVEEGSYDRESRLTLIASPQPLPAPSDPEQENAAFPPSADDPSFDLIHVMAFHDVAQYEPDSDEPERSGLEAWGQYQSGGRTASLELGLYPTAILDVEGVLAGIDHGWDQVQIIHMSSREGFRALLDDETRSAGRYHRYAALEHNYSLISTPEVSAIPYAFWGLSLPVLLAGAATAVALVLAGVGWIVVRAVRRRASSDASGTR